MEGLDPTGRQVLDQLRPSGAGVGYFSDLVAFLSDLEVGVQQQLLELVDPLERAERVMELMRRAKFPSAYLSKVRNAYWRKPEGESSK
jgi:hypothetical protein